MGSHGPPNKGKGLDDLMMAYTDLSSKTKTSGFRGPPVKDLKTTNPKSANTFQTSNKSRDWSTFNMDLETAFSSNPPPASQTQPFVPHPQLLLHHSVQPSFLHPQQPSSLSPAATQDTDDWGDFQDFSATEQPLSLPHNPFTVVNSNPNLLPLKNPPSLPPTLPLHQVSNLSSLTNPNVQAATSPSPCSISFSTIPTLEKAANEPTSDFGDFQDFVSAPPTSARSIGSTLVAKSSLKPSAVSLPPTKDLIQSEQLSEAIGSRLATFQDESPVHRFKSSAMPQALAATSALEDDFGDFSLATIGPSPATLLPQPSRSDTSKVPASDKYSVFRDFLESSHEGPARQSPPSPATDLLNSSLETLITLPASNPPQPLSVLPAQSPTISLNTSADILLAPSANNNDDFGDFAGLEFSSSSANLGSIVTPTNPFSCPSPDDEWSLPCEVPPPLPATTQNSSTWISSSPPPPEYQPATKTGPKMSYLNVEEFSLPSEQLELSDRELFGTRAYEEPTKNAPVNSLQGIYNMQRIVKTLPVEDDCDPGETENEFDLCSVMVSSPLREKSSSPDSMLSHLPVPANCPETQSVASLEFESPGESASRHGSVVSLELSEAKAGGEELESRAGAGGEELESPNNEWSLTLAQISHFIDTVRQIYTAQADEVKLELAESEEGFAYLSNLVQVYCVYKRIALAVHARGAHELRTQCEHIEESWVALAAQVPGDVLAAHVPGDVLAAHVPRAVLAAHVPGDVLAAHVPGDVLASPYHSSTSSSESSSCGLCLQDVGSAKLWYAGQEYHAACANLWVNCVDSVLPSLSI